MADKSKNKPVPAKPASSAEKHAAEKTTNDGLQPGRQTTNTREQVREQKTSQGQPNRG